MFRKDKYSIDEMTSAIDQLEEKLKNTSEYPTKNQHGVTSKYEIARRVVAEYREIPFHKLQFKHIEKLHERLLNGIVIIEYQEILNTFRKDSKAEATGGEGVAYNRPAVAASGGGATHNPAAAAGALSSQPEQSDILSIEPKTKAEFEAYGEKAYEVRKKDPDKINLIYLKKAAENNFPVAKMVMTCTLCNKFSSKDLLAIIYAHRHDDKFIQFIKSPSEHNIQPKPLFIILQLAKHNVKLEDTHHHRAADDKHGIDPDIKAALEKMNKNLIPVLKEFKKKKLDPYEILGIQDENLDEKALEKAYKKKLLEVHPDKHVRTIQNDPNKAVHFQEQADLATKARDLLKDPNAKKFFKPPQQPTAAAALKKG